ncbi:[FeFe] hydrogenase H-cluster maturation GTPase HydF [bacterium M21]|nr:[FeFe] hydrogenase H-cluster maturation GTPase HydF [bacterium M21]
MQKTPKALRLHIGVFGRRNVGKSSIFNALIHQDVSIVSNVAGTTTDPVEKAMELQPIGPVVFIDTAGIDDVGALGEMRIEKSKKAINRTDVAILMTDDWQSYEEELLRVFTEQQIPTLVVVNKADLGDRDVVVAAALEAGAQRVLQTSAKTGQGIGQLRREIIQSAPEDFINSPAIIGDLVEPGDLVVLVTPIDKEAPKGRLILPQVQTIRDLLDNDAMSMVVKERELAESLKLLKNDPAMIVTDSQAFLKVAADTPMHVPMTSFSILFARFKGDLAEMVRGAVAIDQLKPGSKVLMGETCSHHPIADDIGRVKIPRWLEQYVGGKLDFTMACGRDYPEDVSEFDLIVHCGACVWNRREMLSRIAASRAVGTPITNYGLTIAYSLGIFERALDPFPFAKEIYLEEMAKLG